VSEPVAHANRKLWKCQSLNNRYAHRPTPSLFFKPIGLTNLQSN
jgi:hypothetical protein